MYSLSYKKSANNQHAPSRALLLHQTVPGSRSTKEHLGESNGFWENLFWPHGVDWDFKWYNFKSNNWDFTFSAPPAKHSESLLGLLTSMGGIFTFETKNLFGFSFASLATDTGISGVFEKFEKPFRFGDVAKPIDQLEKPSQDEQNQPLESGNDSTQLEDDDDGPHFESTVPLPDKIDVKTGEEEQELFCNRAKLYRFEMETKEWKERGIGNIKILKHNTSGKVRILMRREQVLKICANHYINADTLLKPNAGSDKSWVWNAIDYADEQPKPEQLAIRFKTAEEALLFKTKFDEAQQNVPKSPAKHCLQEKRDVGCKLNETQSSFGAQFALKDGEWDCNVCYVWNKPKDIQCVACQTKNPKSVSKPEGTTVTYSKPAREEGAGMETEETETLLLSHPPLPSLERLLVSPDTKQGAHTCFRSECPQH